MSVAVRIKNLGNQFLATKLPAIPDRKVPDESQAAAGFPGQEPHQKELDSNTVCHIVCVTQWMRHSMTTDTNLFENLRLELRRGSLIVAVLAQLRTEQYGYTLRKALAEHGMAIDEGTLYPLLRRLESQGLLSSEWREEDKRNKRFYVLSADGERMLGMLLAEWNAINTAVENIL